MIGEGSCREDGYMEDYESREQCIQAERQCVRAGREGGGV